MGAAGTEAYRQVRSDAARLPEEAPESDISGDAPERDTERTPVGDRRDSEPPFGRDDAETGEDKDVFRKFPNAPHGCGANQKLPKVSRSDGAAESREPNEMGGLDEHAESVGGKICDYWSVGDKTDDPQ